jgi:mannose-6-phosphate isomerase-like protein (cupin superfamily)
MEIRRMERKNFTSMKGIELEMLHPWPALNAPFTGAWVVVPAGSASYPHSHHQGELFIGISGSAAIVVDGEHREFAAGDLVHLLPNCHHTVINDGEQDFHYYAIWWDTDACEGFVTRHRAAAAQNEVS